MTTNNQSWDHSVDVVVVGSGAGAMTAALRATHAGANTLIVEKGAHYGGTSATAGGALWIPVNHLMAACGIEDSYEDAMRYMQALTGADVPENNVVSYVKNAARMLRWVVDNSRLEFQAMGYYADYYQHLPGSKKGARTIDPQPYTAQELGDEFLNLQEPHQQTRVLGLMGYSNTEGAILLSKAPGWFKVLLKLAFAYFLDLPWRFKSKRSRRLTMGNALIGRLRKSLLDHNVPLWLNCPATELIVDGSGAIAGVKVKRDGKVVSIQTKRGVILGSGGFEHNQALREKYLPKPTKTRWSAANPTNTGDMLVAAQTIGASTALLDEAWWGPTISLDQEDRARMLFAERSMPGCIIVNRAGQRFFNESVAYTTAVQAMHKPGNLPAYLIFDSRYKREYPFGPLLPGGMHLNWLQPSYVKNNLLKTAHSLDVLARAIGVDPKGLTDSVNRFNTFAKNGKDEDFQRGENSYDLIYGDVRVQPNPCLAPLREGPFYAIETFPGDIGTKGGLATNEHAQVLDTKGVPIKGLYAIGNCSASVTGRYYPGAGATLGPAMTFGFLAAEHVCGGVAQAAR